MPPRKSIVLPPVPSLVENGEYMFNMYMYTKPQLRELLRQKEISTSGTKDELVERLLSAMTELEMYRMLKGNCHHALKAEGRGGFETKLRGGKFQSHASIVGSKKRGVGIDARSNRYNTPITDKEKFVRGCEPARKKMESKVVEIRRVELERREDSELRRKHLESEQRNAELKRREDSELRRKNLESEIRRAESERRKHEEDVRRRNARMVSTDTLDIGSILAEKKRVEEEYRRSHSKPRSIKSSQSPIDVSSTLAEKKRVEEEYYRLHPKSRPGNTKSKTLPYEPSSATKTAPASSQSYAPDIGGYVSGAASFIGDVGGRLFGYFRDSLPQQETPKPPEKQEEIVRVRTISPKPSARQLPEVRKSVTMPQPRPIVKSPGKPLHVMSQRSQHRPIVKSPEKPLPLYNFPKVPTSPPKPPPVPVQFPVLVSKSPPLSSKVVRQSMYPRLSPIKKAQSVYSIPKGHEISEDILENLFESPKTMDVSKKLQDIEIDDEELENLLHSPVKQKSVSIPKYKIPEDIEISEDLLDNLDDLIAARNSTSHPGLRPPSFPKLSPKSGLRPPSFPRSPPKSSITRKSPKSPSGLRPSSPALSSPKSSIKRKSPKSPISRNSHKSPSGLRPPSPVLSSPKSSIKRKSPKSPSGLRPPSPALTKRKSSRRARSSSCHKVLYYAALSRHNYPTSPVQKECDEVFKGSLEYICMNCFKYKDLKKALVEKYKVSPSLITDKYTAIRLLLKKFSKQDIVDLLKANGVTMSRCDSKKKLLTKLWADKPIRQDMKVSTKCLTCNHDSKLKLI